MDRKESPIKKIGTNKKFLLSKINNRRTITDMSPIKR